MWSNLVQTLGTACAKAQRQVPSVFAKWIFVDRRVWIGGKGGIHKINGRVSRGQIIKDIKSHNLGFILRMRSQREMLSNLCKQVLLFSRNTLMLSTAEKSSVHLADEWNSPTTQNPNSFCHQLLPQVIR